jgi:hypothetical protein
VDPHLPFLLVRAVPLPEERDAFQQWFSTVHLRDVRRIPGFRSIQSARTREGACLGIYTFKDAETIQATLSSPEAAYARGTWEQWAPSLEELVVEIFAPLLPLSLYRSHN